MITAKEVAETLEILRALEWTEVDPDPRPCYAVCPMCRAKTTRYGPNGWYGEHPFDCSMRKAIARFERKMEEDHD